jgi:Pre-toxin TG
MSSPEVKEEVSALHQATEELTSFVTSGVPILGTAKGITEMYTGRDVFTEQPVSKLEAGIEIGFGLLPEAGFFKQGAVRLADKMFGRQALESTTPVADHLGSVATETKAAISNSSASLFGKTVGSAKVPTGLTARLNRTQIREYLSGVHNVSREQLIRNLESVGLKFKGSAESGKFMSFVDKRGNVRIKIHPSDRITQYEHMHIYNKNAQDLSADLSSVHYRSPEAHIEIAPDSFGFSQEYYNKKMMNGK